MGKWIEFYKNLPWYIKNIYFAIALFFVLWMLFFDQNNMFYQIKLSRKLSKLEGQKHYFQEQIQDVESTKEELFSTAAKKEKFAREKYHMKKDNEDIFIIEVEE